MYRLLVFHKGPIVLCPLIADLFLYCFESHFMVKFFNDPSKHDLLHELNIFRYLDDILAVNNLNFENLPKRT